MTVGKIQTAADLIRQVAEIGEIHINLLLTRKCNFACKMCMYSASPKLSADYMTYDDLSAVNRCAEDMQDMCLAARVCLGEQNYGSSYSCFNLVGGEPTLDMDKFCQILEWAYRGFKWSSIEMTTNGWWLREPARTAQFIEAVAPIVEYDEDRLRIRISSSEFHDPFRKKEKRIVESSTSFENFFGVENYDSYTDMADVLSGEDALKCLCGCPFGESEDCTACGLPKYDSLDASRAQSLSWDKWQMFCRAVERGNIYVDRQPSHGWVPVGRAIKNGIGFKNGSCHPSDDVKFTFMPGAKIYDVCCNGAHNPFGGAEDGAYLLFERVAFIADLHTTIPDKANTGPRCSGCAAYGIKWRATRGKIYAPIIKEALEICRNQEVEA